MKPVAYSNGLDIRGSYGMPIPTISNYERGMDATLMRSMDQLNKRILANLHNLTLKQNPKFDSRELPRWLEMCRSAFQVTAMFVGHCWELMCFHFIIFLFCRLCCLVFLFFWYIFVWFCALDYLFEFSILFL